jgi:hypothetical protein
MPQQVTIELHDGTRARLTTSNCGPGTAYRVMWQDKWISEKLDTGVATQGRATNRNADNNCDFTHARRALAAAGRAAELVIAELTPEAAPFQGATILLSTNNRERGRIPILPDQSDQLSIEIRIGTSQEKPIGSHPEEVFTLSPYRVRRPQSRSRMELVFRVIAAEYEEILSALKANKLPGSAEP